ncbi:MAG: hypothetical protein WA021_02835 [Minisyncoccia bacterium]
MEMTMAQADKLGQALQLVSVLMTNTDWEHLDWKALQDKVINKPTETGDAFTEFLEDLTLPPLQIMRSCSMSLEIGAQVTIADVLGRGHYFWADLNINDETFKSFARPKTAFVNVELACFSRWVRTDRICKMLESIGYRNADLLELLEFGAEHPDEQRAFDIVALGTSERVPDSAKGAKNKLCVAKLTGDGSGRRDVHLVQRDGRPWDNETRFLIVRNN